MDYTVVSTLLQVAYLSLMPVSLQPVLSAENHMVNFTNKRSINSTYYSAFFPPQKNNYSNFITQYCYSAESKNYIQQKSSENRPMGQMSVPFPADKNV